MNDIDIACEKIRIVRNKLIRMKCKTFLSSVKHLEEALDTLSTIDTDAIRRECADRAVCYFFNVWAKGIEYYDDDLSAAILGKTVDTEYWRTRALRAEDRTVWPR